MGVPRRRWRVRRSAAGPSAPPPRRRGPARRRRPGTSRRPRRSRRTSPHPRARRGRRCGSARRARPDRCWAGMDGNRLRWKTSATARSSASSRSRCSSSRLRSIARATVRTRTSLRASSPGLGRRGRVVHGEGAQHPPADTDDRRRPARPEPGAQGEVAVVGPQGVGLDVLDDHLPAPVRRRTARADRRPDLLAVDGLVVEGGQARCGAVPKVPAGLVEEEDRGEQPTGRDPLHHPQQRLQRMREGAPGHHAGQQLQLGGEQQGLPVLARPGERRADTHRQSTVRPPSQGAGHSCSVHHWW